MTGVHELALRITADMAAFDKATRQMGQRLDAVGKRVSAVGGGLTKWVTGPLLGAGAGLLALANKSATLGDELAKTSTKLGISTAALQEMEYWASQNGISSDAMERAVGRLNQRIGRAATGNDKYAEAFQSLSVDIVDAAGKIRDTESVMQDTIAALREVEDPALRSALAAEIFGTKMARDLMPALEDGSLSLEDAAEKARELGIIMGEDSIAASEDYIDAMDDLNRSLGAVWREVAEKFIPILTDEVIPIIQDKVIPAISDFSDRIMGLIDWFMELDPHWQKLIGAAIGLAIAIGPILLVVGKMIVLFGAVLNPVGLIVIAIAGLIAILVLAWQRSETFRDIVLAVFETVRNFVVAAMEFVQDTIETITSAIRNWWETWGDDIIAFASDTWDRVWGIISAALELIWTIVSGIGENILAFWDRWGDTIISTLQFVWDVVLAALATAWGLIESTIRGALQIIQGVLDVFIGVFTGDWERAWGGISGIVRGAANVIIGFINAIIGAAERMVNALSRAVNRIPTFSIPSWVPVIGGNSFGIPNIPRISLPRIPTLHGGTDYFMPPGGGMEGLALLQRGEQVIPRGEAQQPRSANILVYLDGREIGRAIGQPLVDEIRVRTGVRI